MPQFRVTLNFSVNIHHWEEYDYAMNKDQKKIMREAFERTDAYYDKHPIEDYIKTNSAMGMVECVLCDSDVTSAEWDTNAFALHMVVETDATLEGLRRDLEMNSLEDGEYEACGESGWILFTRGPEGEVFYGGEGSEDVWEYALVDYRQNYIEIVPI